MNGLETHQLSCGYPNRRVLEDLSLDVQPGEVLALLGPNGSGKTTLLRTLARLLAPQKGSVVLHEQDIWAMRADESARQVALTPQTERRDWPLSVEESVALGRAPHRGWLLPFTEDDRNRVERALHCTGLTELRHRPIPELSGGEWRRMVLARALAQGAGVLLLDEPTAGLDLKYQVDILHLVRGLAAAEGLMVVLTLHDLNHAALYADRIAVLSEHTLIAVGSPEEVLTADSISRTFGIPVTVTPHPVYGTPLVVPLVNVRDGFASTDE
ncbi:MAG: ABC transporter ATP-binding protein [Pirellulaceae bacterium]